jgi:hypothetical protein
MYTRPLGFDSFWTHTAVWGRNNGTDGERSNAYLYETEYRRGGDAIFARFEQVGKTGLDLVLPAPLSDETFPAGAYTVGLVHDLPHRPSRTVQAVGAAFTVNSKPAALSPFYGAGTPVSFHVYYRLRPAALVGQDTSR